MSASERLVVYLDGVVQPLPSDASSASLALDTRALSDGAHTLLIEAWDGKGVKGSRSIAFTVRNGPAISVRGLDPDAVVSGKLSVDFHAFGTEDERWQTELAEAPAPIPTWCWVLLIVLLAWALHYVVSDLV
jgi:hypothetical protein